MQSPCTAEGNSISNVEKATCCGPGIRRGRDSAPQPRSARPAQDCKVTLASRQMSSGGPQGGDGAFYLAWDLALEMCKPLKQPCRLSQLHIQPSQGAKSRSGCMCSRLRKYGVGVILPLRHHLYGRCKALELAISDSWREFRASNFEPFLISRNRTRK